MVSEFINRNKPVDADENTTNEDEEDEEAYEKTANGDDTALSNPVLEVADDESSQSDLQEIEEYLYENEDQGRVRPLKKRPRMMEIPYSTGF